MRGGVIIWQVVRYDIFATGPAVDTLRDSPYTPVISLKGVAPNAHIISHVVKIQAAFIGPIL
jgi:hypothetical protein